LSAASPSQNHEGLSAATRDAIGKQLDRLLASPYFSHSKRLPNFLRFIVERTLDGDAERMKERTLGIEVFGRDANYDTASDPIVRVTAAELRKRVAQYYQEPAHEEELRIALPSGCYVPQFHLPKNGNNFDSPEANALPLVPAEQAVLLAQAGPARRLWLTALAIILIAMTMAGVIAIWERTHRSGFEQFWQPLLSSNEPVLLCVADQTEYSEIALRDATQPSRQLVLSDHLTAVVIDDLNATVKVAGILQSGGKQYTLKGEGDTTLDDLRRGPTVFVGAFDNAWTLRLTNPLRYHFANDANMTHFWIADGNTPGPSRWVVDRGVQLATNNYRDYGILARFNDSNTGKVAVVVAGIGRGGTRVAGEFLADNADLAQLMRSAHASGDKKNFEIVLSTEIIDGEPGSPKIEGTYFW
jgi:hypothetical protein